MSASESFRPFLSAHARQRCVEMAVPHDEVLGVIARPEVRYSSPAEYGPNRVVSVGGRLAVVHTSSGDVVVITVLWRGLEGREPSSAA